MSIIIFPETFLSKEIQKKGPFYKIPFYNKSTSNMTTKNFPTTHQRRSQDQNRLAQLPPCLTLIMNEDDEEQDHLPLSTRGRAPLKRAQIAALLQAVLEIVEDDDLEFNR
jgi:hypothetical protein